ncbi:uncharacterized protein LOC112348870 [Selaginella moellendorffii]|uniref:uncharacterized protein LOC112348870 n=1 Tax=Selaginella moellendorffii TaxID=88036 RepID=UPI000D1C31C9|nr:uncharacterized protein LOC112348870 [Selaginella moellendorffii]XP_024537948.1 uncharacterized protein LOC112348870 [Selaginella moellendorffii]XP_024537949.1 uncharacterized protein LOC112348870 [Selaginella moellendorffii]|eukprot:XP_024537947.1 uncharacterized protein LOC112348870 [Selaginella moellendorffii]
MPPSASKAPNATGAAEVRYSAAKHSPLTPPMDRAKGGQQQRHRHPFLLPQQQQQQQRQSSFSLGCIFDNPVAFEDSSSGRRKIDYTGISSEARMDMLECQIKSVDAWNGVTRAPDLVSPAQQQRELRMKMKIQAQQREAKRWKRDGVGASLHKQAAEVEDASYDPARPVAIQTCRRKLCLDDPLTTATTNDKAGFNTPLLDDCEIYSDVSDSVPEDVGFNGLPAARSRKEERNTSGFCTPVRDALQSRACSPISDDGTASLRSLNALDNSMEAGCCGIELEDIGTDTSRRESFRSLKACATAREGPYFVYPGWSMWSREHSYRSLTQDSPLSKNSCAPSIKNLPGVKTLRASLRQHLAAAAAGQRHISSGSVKRSSSTNTRSSTVSESTSIRKSRRGASTTNVASKCGKFTVVEEARVPLLKPQRTVRKHFSPRKHWEPVTFFRKGLKSLASKGFPHDGFSFPSVFPLPGCGLPRLDQSHLMKPKRLLSEKRRSLLEKIQDSKNLDATTSFTGYLQCILRHGLTSYSFWMDELDEVLVARLEQGDRRDKCFSFYTCKGKDKSGWRHWQKIRKRVVNFIGTMSFSCCIYTEVDLKGEVMHFMDSEFSLFDERQPASTTPHRRTHHSKSRVASYLKALLGSPWEGGEHSDAGMKPRKELAAMVIRVPLEVRKASVTVSCHHEKFALEKTSSTTTTWSSIVGAKGESIHVVLPTGDHGHPTYGLEGPRPLVERWRSGGLCDCGSWDLGCGMVTLSKDKDSSNRDNASSSSSLNLVVEGVKRKFVTMSLSPCREDGLYRLSFQRPLMGLQAFASAVAILHSKIHTGGEVRYGSASETKLPVTLIARRDKSLRSSCHPNPPVSPIERL